MVNPDGVSFYYFESVIVMDLKGDVTDLKNGVQEV